MSFTEEIGNGVHYGTRKKLAEFGISVDGKYAVQLKKSDYAKYDYIIGMDSYNLRNMKRMLPNDTENKIHLLLDWSDNPRDIADPWYLKVALLYSRKSKKSFKALFLYQTPQKYYTLKHKKIQFICY